MYFIPCHEYWTDSIRAQINIAFRSDSGHGLTNKILFSTQAISHTTYDLNRLLVRYSRPFIDWTGLDHFLIPNQFVIQIPLQSVIQILLYPLHRIKLKKDLYLTMMNAGDSGVIQTVGARVGFSRSKHKFQKLKVNKFEILE